VRIGGQACPLYSFRLAACGASLWLEVIESNNHPSTRIVVPITKSEAREAKLDIQQFQQFPRTVPIDRLECAKEFRRSAALSLQERSGRSQSILARNRVT
jgi:hypothetical protein